MWSRNGTPVDTFAVPVPTFKTTVTAVSEVRRSTLVISGTPLRPLENRESLCISPFRRSRQQRLRQQESEGRSCHECRLSCKSDDRILSRRLPSVSYTHLT